MYCIKSAVSKNVTAFTPCKNLLAVKGQCFWTTSKEPPTNYEILGVKKDASSKEIKEAYFELCKTMHPDSNSGTKDVQNFVELNKAYNVLINESKRARYDKKLKGEEFYNQGLSSEETKDTVVYAPYIRIFILIIYVIGLTQFGKKQNYNVRSEWRSSDQPK
ncbi:dnaJ homolog subfamily C member 4-like [Saccostrea cucullata]|uniref:dnaJ homolog subfamily C member 4-like n=1 Tax=Saccostrea cuccullata TaxID=36930 RepID=UPI002ED48854